MMSDPRNNQILFWVPGGMAGMLQVEGAIAKALQYRGCEVHAILCDGPFRACIRREVKDGIPILKWSEFCASCKESTARELESMGISYSFIGDYVPAGIREDLWAKTSGITWENIEKLEHDGVGIGKNAQSAVIRYLQGLPFAGNEAVVREYAFSACLCAEAAKNAFKQINPTKIFMSHGTYIDYGPALQMAFHMGIPVTAWMASYLTARFYFRHVEDNIRIDFHNMSGGAWNTCRAAEFKPEQELRLELYLRNRYQKQVSFDMQRLKEYSGKTTQLRQKYAPQPNRPVWGIVSHINWDCVSDYSPMAYASFDEWIIDTINEIKDITDIQWLIKIHPAEAWDNPSSGVQKLIERYFPELPSHIKVIPAEEAISPLDFFEMIDGGVTVYGTSGLEFLLQGKPVILAGEAHYGGKGFTYDGLTKEAYKQLLQKAGSLPKINAEQQLLARKYAYCYFIERQIPFPVVYDPNSSWWRFQPNKAYLLLPGKDPFTDFICDRILDGNDFIMSGKLAKLAEAVYDLHTMDRLVSFGRKLNRWIRMHLLGGLGWAVRN
jgi:hypothetical protein